MKMPLLAFLNGKTAENSYLVDFYMLKFFMIRPASVSLHSGVSPENRTSSLSPLIHSHMWHLHQTFADAKDLLGSSDQSI